MFCKILFDRIRIVPPPTNNPRFVHRQIKEIFLENFFLYKWTNLKKDFQNLKLAEDRLKNNTKIDPIIKNISTKFIEQRNNKIVENNGVRIMGESNILNKLPISSSNLYAKNVFNFVDNLFDKKSKKININLEDEIIEKTLIK